MSDDQSKIHHLSDSELHELQKTLEQELSSRELYEQLPIVEKIRRSSEMIELMKLLGGIYEYCVDLPYLYYQFKHFGKIYINLTGVNSEASINQILHLIADYTEHIKKFLQIKTGFSTLNGVTGGFYSEYWIKLNGKMDYDIMFDGYSDESFSIYGDRMVCLMYSREDDRWSLGTSELYDLMNRRFDNDLPITHYIKDDYVDHVDSERELVKRNIQSIISDEEIDRLFDVFIDKHDALLEQWFIYPDLRDV